MSVPDFRRRTLVSISAKRLSRIQLEEGNLTKGEFDRINRKADGVLREKPED